MAIDPSSNIWIFGGWGKDSTSASGQLNDLWKFNISSGQWTWMTGTNLVDQNGVYGTLKTAAAANTPGTRQNLTMASDPSGNIWLFGGMGRDKNGNNSYLNDLWKFNGSQWTWMSGSSVVGNGGTYGTRGVGSTSNKPGDRNGAGIVVDSNAKIWVFGGFGNDGAGSTDTMNDLWKFDPSNDQWTWISGSSTARASGVYGAKNIFSASFTPGAREQVRIAIDSANNIYILDGIGFDSVGTKGYLNEIWKYKP
jgi:N-acetylneuraminic acid mutarotase